MDEGKTSFERLLSVMPEGWEAKAKELGALVRGRELKNAVELLRLVSLYLTEGKSFSGTAVLLALGGSCSISKKAVFTRLQRCGEWLRWLCEYLYRNNHGIREAPVWLEGRKVNVRGYFKGLQPEGIGEQTLDYKHEGEYKPLRLCVLRKPKEAEEKGLESVRKTRMRKHGDKELSVAQVAYNRMWYWLHQYPMRPLNCYWICTARGGR
ncbi:MAG: hypothetical protein LBK02_07510 [Treponema sp.]|jgi:hypothetical protein|nr:hypothetical protein [Treponema sp.]